MLKNELNFLYLTIKINFKKMSKENTNSKPVVFYGVNQVMAVVKSAKRKVFEIIATAEGLKKLRSKGLKSNFIIKEVSIAHINNAMGLSSVNHQGAVCIASSVKDIEIEKHIETAKFIVILNNITDIGNIGSIIRSATAFNANLIIANKFGMPNILNNGDVCKASAGASEFANLCQIASLAKWIGVLKNKGFVIAGLDGKGDVEIQNLLEKSSALLKNKPVKLALIVGSEGKGIEDKLLPLCNFICKIPISKLTESLNAAVAVSVAMYEISKIFNNK
jgi:23S rRNA (guanosine2251-2'-O)-methyltransferase